MLEPYGVPVWTRPILHQVNDRCTRWAIASTLKVLRGSARAPSLACCRDLFGAANERLSVFYGTDDFVAGASSWASRARLQRLETRNLEQADRWWSSRSRWPRGGNGPAGPST